MLHVLYVLTWPICFFIVLLTSFFIFIQYKKYIWKSKRKRLISIGFFHPYCNAGGGGERVLWTAVVSIQNRYINAHCVIYTGDVTASKSEILSRVESQFNITLLRDVEFIFLNKRYFVEAKYYPYFTLLLQSLGSIILGFEALIKHVPDVYLDTMGYAFTIPIFKYFALSKVGAYVHYPTISTDMLDTVLNRKVAVNNRRFITNSTFFSLLKTIYYKLFAKLYGFVGRQAEIIMVNSSWTREHIIQLWKKPDYTYTVYPPCDVSKFAEIRLKLDYPEKYGCRILSIAQFRPEKNHELQLRIFHEVLQRLPDDKKQIVTLVLVGSCRDDEDQQRVTKLKEICHNLDISNKVEFKINLAFKEILIEMEKASIALHTMWNEHFGIGLVECMSAGLVMIAHDSGGPKMDIIRDHNMKKTGFLADDIQSYANAIENILNMKPEELYELRRNARESVAKFSVDKFRESFLFATRHIF